MPTMKASALIKLAKAAIGPRVSVWTSHQKDGIGATTSEWGRGVIIYYPDKKLREAAMVAALKVIEQGLQRSRTRRKAK